MLKKIRELVNKKDLKFLLLLLFMGLILSFIEVLGVAILMPFISMISNPDIIQSNEYLKIFYDTFDFTTNKNFIIFCGFLLISFYLFRAVYSMLFTYLLNRFTLYKYKSFVNQIFKNYLELPYKSFVKNNSSEMLKVIVTETGQISALTINILNFLSEILVVLILYILLLFVDIEMTMILTIVLAIKVLILSKTVSKRIKIKSVERESIEKQYYKVINESLANFKLIKLLGTKNKLLEKFSEISKNFSYIHIYNNTIQTFPRIILESFGFSILIGAIIYLLLFDNIDNLIGVLSMYALALYRTLPAITKIINSYNNIIFHSKSLDIVHKSVLTTSKKEFTEPLEFNHSIKLENISFSYDDKKRIIDNFSLKIRKGQKIAFVGESGSGKSTLVDIICGVYNSSFGQILIDDIKLTDKNIITWRNKIGYIPQNIYLFDGTILENIVFGREYNEEKFIQVLKQANVYDFIMEKKGFETKVGEGGIQLSGGQKQRIGIARSLYGDPEILVLDEATSALDDKTEKSIMKEIYKISEDKTLIVIAHRLSTIENCDIKINLSKDNNDT